MSDEPMTDEVLNDYLRGFEAEGELRGIDCCREIRRLREERKRARGLLENWKDGFVIMSNAGYVNLPFLGKAFDDTYTFLDGEKL